jgi:hypothetical protein
MITAIPDDEDENTSESIDDSALRPKQELALRALLSHSTRKEAAMAAGISDETLWRYMKNPLFLRRLREARREAVQHTITTIQRASSDAVTVLHNLMNKEDAPAAARVTAARTVLDYTFRLDAMEELERQIEELTDFIRMKQEDEQ